MPEGRKRQVTFMKRKQGLLKKAMELSILCQCEMAVVIFSHNGKLYDYGSTQTRRTVARYRQYTDTTAAGGRRLNLPPPKRKSGRAVIFRQAALSALFSLRVLHYRK
jgi:hypothetical protein